MTKSYEQITKEIEYLKVQAAALRKKEVGGVVEQIKKAIAAYGLTARDLGLGDQKSARGSAQSMKPSSRKGAKGKTVGVAKFRDDAGNTWVGRGPRPRWLTTALAAGHSLESFAVSQNGTKTEPHGEDAAARPVKKSAAKPLKLVSPAKFRDAAGNSWSGRGPRPAWLKAAIASGTSIDELAA